MDYLVDADKDQADASILTALTNSDRPPLFHAHVDLEDGRDVFYRYDPSRFETVTFGRDASVRGDAYDLVSSFRGPGDQARDQAAGWTPDAGSLRYRPVDIVGYDIQARVEENLDFSATASLFAFSTAPAGSWAPLQLSSELDVVSVAWDGSPVQFLKGDESSQLWVRLPDGLEPGTPGNLRVAYEGDIIDRQRDWYFLMSATGWYPSQEGTDATFDVVFTTHEKYKLMAGGELVSTEQEGKWVTTRWVVNNPAPHNSFNVGDFDEFEMSDPRVPPVKLHFAESAHLDLNLLTQDDMGEAVGADLVNSLYFFGESFGPTGAEAFNATEIVALHGQAFPSMVQLSFLTFQWTGRDGYAEIFRAHEVAHQWWGLGVRPKTYHDRWLSEGLAEFSGLWYMQRVLMSTEKYSDHLQESRDNILKRRGKAGPIWLGPRVATSESEEDYQTIIYEKGAWVIHMLRNVMLDLETMDQTRFSNLLRDFYQTYQGRSATTEDFLEMVTRHVGVDMEWFFDQWVYGTGVPKYEWATRGETLESGEYLMTLRVEQSEVPDSFKMVVPVRLDFGDEGFAHVRVLVEGPSTVVELPLMPREPEAIVFNDFDSVLAEVEKVGW